MSRRTSTRSSSSARLRARPAPPIRPRFWQDHGPALWNRVMRALSASRGLDIADTARLFASANLASADGAIGCWDSKYHWKFWRPIMAIREADRPSSGGTVATSAATAATREDRLKVRNGYMSPRNRREGRPMVRRETYEHVFVVTHQPPTDWEHADTAPFTF